MTDIEYIAQKLSQEDILCQLAEEASELAQAALKLRRVITGTNPTPVSEDEALRNLHEEIIDVSLAEKVYFEQSKHELVGASGLIANGKAYRRAQRPKAIEDANTNRKPVAPTDIPTDAPTAGGAKTRQEKFLELFPHAAIRRGALDICPGKIDTQHCADFDSCLDCQREYWLAAEKEDSHD